ncbi:methyltransferase domain-containing protein [Lacinutrix sp. WUR7]|uniref:class I SAM-dependent methyltransferase n=1 Tax=Lacinutrix sp. WUR7 TaxID=2653681 RepID=UPI00193EBB40|nr:class I SAM-dependent methyltransferase [Lacinutrix sp. WUR7]QRM90263.1 methyltransferase domain-containing protein [Lacinutrix sp. WUR7]
MKDNFSTESDKYAKYRPIYPEAFFDYLKSLMERKQIAWDCGTGNGQVAYKLAQSFDTVMASDLSQAQIDNASKSDNIYYTVQRAEKTNYADAIFDLIIVSQAIHWFDFDAFYKEVKRTLHPNGFLCVVGYGTIQMSGEIGKLIAHFYSDIIGSYWDEERKYLDENYQSIPFPFQEIETPTFINTLYWSLEHLIGYLNTWSSVKHFIDQNAYNPVDSLQLQLEKHWNSEDLKEVKFPILLRIGRLKE